MSYSFPKHSSKEEHPQESPKQETAHDAGWCHSGKLSFLVGLQAVSTEAKLFFNCEKHIRLNSLNTLKLDICFPREVPPLFNAVSRKNDSHVNMPLRTTHCDKRVPLCSQINESFLCLYRVAPQKTEQSIF